VRATRPGTTEKTESPATRNGTANHQRPSAGREPPIGLRPVRPRRSRRHSKETRVVRVRSPVGGDRRGFIFRIRSHLVPPVGFTTRRIRGSPNLSRPPSLARGKSPCRGKTTQRNEDLGAAFGRNQREFAHGARKLTVCSAKALRLRRLCDLRFFALFRFRQRFTLQSQPLSALSGRQRRVSP